MTRILVVEDEPAILRGLMDNLRYESYEVLGASDGETGYRLIREKKPDLIILDLMLPRTSGTDLCRRIRSEGMKTPVLMLTAKGEEADRVRGLRAWRRRLRHQAVFHPRAAGEDPGDPAAGRSGPRGHGRTPVWGCGSGFPQVRMPARR